MYCRVSSCTVFSHIGVCKHILAINHCKEKGRPEADQRQSLNLRLLARSLYVAKGKSEKGPGGGTGYRMHRIPDPQPVGTTRGAASNT